MTLDATRLTSEETKVYNILLNIEQAIGLKKLVDNIKVFKKKPTALKFVQTPIPISIVVEGEKRETEKQEIKETSTKEEEELDNNQSKDTESITQAKPLDSDKMEKTIAEITTQYLSKHLENALSALIQDLRCPFLWEEISERETVPVDFVRCGMVSFDWEKSKKQKKFF